MQSGGGGLGDQASARKRMEKVGTHRSIVCESCLSDEEARMLDDRLANLDARRQRRKKQDAGEEVILRLERDSSTSPTSDEADISTSWHAKRETTNRTSSMFRRHAESIPLTTFGRTSSSPFWKRNPRWQSALRTGSVGPTRSTSLVSSLSSSARELISNGKKEGRRTDTHASRSGTR